MKIALPRVWTPALVFPFFLLVFLLPQDPFLSGSVFWERGGPAVGVKVELVSGTEGRVLDTRYTNSNGSYAFFDVEEEPSTCIVRALVNGNVEDSDTLSAVTPGTEVDDMTVPFPGD